MTSNIILIRKFGVHFCKVYYVHLVLMMHVYFKIFVIVYLLFLSLAKQRLKDQFIQNVNGRLQESSRAIFYKHISSFRFKPYSIL